MREQGGDEDAAEEDAADEFAGADGQCQEPECARDRVGIAENLRLPFPEYMPPRVRMPKKNKRGQWTNWSNTALPWMSIGYETNVPPISVVTFYNAIANGGVMVRPRLVTKIEKDGEVIKEFPVEVLKRQICSKETLGKVQTMLRQVVSIGLGKTAGSPSFAVSGKTGTAQKAMGGGYKNGTVNYLLSFCGYVILVSYASIRQDCPLRAVL